MSAERGIIEKMKAVSPETFRVEMQLSSHHAENVEQMIHGRKFATIRLEDVEFRENGTVWKREEPK